MKTVTCFFSFRADMNCESSFTSNTYRTAAELAKQRQSSFEMEVGVSVSAEVEFGLVSFGGEMSASFKQNHASDVAYRTLAEAQGEVTVSKVRKMTKSRPLSYCIWQAICNTHDISIGKFVRPRFSNDFITAITRINEAMNVNATHAVELYDNFVLFFGT